MLRMRKLLVILAGMLATLVFASPASAANCYYANAQGSTGPANWQTYCWLDFSSYNNTAARSAAGQNLSYTLPDGTLMTFNLKVSGAAMAQAASPSWTGAAVGNTAFLGIAGRPILYQTAAGTTTITFSNITLTPPSNGSITNFMFVAGDGESSNDGESLRFQTNGGAWQMLDQVGPITGSNYPTYTGIGTTTFTETGVAGTVGAYVVGSTNPTQVSTRLVGGGLQGAMFAIRFASIRLDTQIVGARANPADQFVFSVDDTSTGATFASGTTTGTGLGPFPAAALSSTAALPLTLRINTASGSANALSHYQTLLNCTNASTSSTPMPANIATAEYNFGSLQFGDTVSCRYTATPFPHLALSKALAPTGRQFAGDQFVMTIAQGGTVVASTTTAGTGNTISAGSTPQYQAIPGTAYSMSEASAGTTLLEQYSSAMACTNAASGSATVLPTASGGIVTPQMGDIISCVITNTRRAPNARLETTKISSVLSDPVSGANNPKAIPGASVIYTIAVHNSGPSPVDSDSVFIVDLLPAQIMVGAGSSPSFTQGSPSSGLTFNPALDVRYSDATSPPASFAACTYVPVIAFDPAIRYICINPKGTLAGSTGVPPGFAISFQSQIR